MTELYKNERKGKRKTTKIRHIWETTKTNDNKEENGNTRLTKGKQNMRETTNNRRPNKTRKI